MTTRRILHCKYNKSPQALLVVNIVNIHVTFLLSTTVIIRDRIVHTFFFFFKLKKAGHQNFTKSQTSLKFEIFTTPGHLSKYKEGKSKL